MVFELHVPACPLINPSFMPSRLAADLDLLGREKPTRLTPKRNCVISSVISNTPTLNKSAVEVIRHFMKE